MKVQFDYWYFDKNGLVCSCCLLLLGFELFCLDPEFGHSFVEMRMRVVLPGVPTVTQWEVGVIVE